MSKYTKGAKTAEQLFNDHALDVIGFVQKRVDEKDKQPQGIS
jgi:hypothetical protein